MPFGRPVVPEENSTHSGASNGTRSNRSSAGVAVASARNAARVGIRRVGQARVGHADGGAQRGQRLLQRGDLARSTTRPFHR